jgi:succinate dehydrogenase / fumarate reductase, cytochrome b subunit
MISNSFLRSSIGQKLLVAVSGAILVFFAVFHLLGNLWLIPEQGTVYNLYAANLNRYPILHGAAELLLATAAVVHVGMSIAIARQNRLAKPVGYLVTAGWQKWWDRSMIITGPLLFIFLLVHLRSFRLGLTASYQVTEAGRWLTDWQQLVRDTFQQPWYVAFYVVMMVPLAVHLRHGIGSVVRSWGLAVSRGMEKASWGLAIAIAVGFAVIPVSIYWQGG